MAKVEVVTLMDSLDERIKSDVETVTFYNPITGTKMEIELGEANRKHFGNHLAKLEKYIASARVVEVAKLKPTKVASAGEQSKVREWAKANGYAVGDRGRIKAEIVNAYREAMKSETIDKVMGADEPEEELTTVADSTLVSALENSAQGNVEDLGDFTQYVDDDEPVNGSQEASQGTDEAWEGDGPTDAEILAMMSELAAENDAPSMEDLKAALDSQHNND